MEKLSRDHFKQAKVAGRALNLAAKSMRILSSVAWDEGQKDRFLKDGKMPNPDYTPIDVSEPRRLIAEARNRLRVTILSLSGWGVWRRPWTEQPI